MDVRILPNAWIQEFTQIRWSLLLDVALPWFVHHISAFIAGNPHALTKQKTRHALVQISSGFYLMLLCYQIFFCWFLSIMLFPWPYCCSYSFSSILISSSSSTLLLPSVVSSHSQFFFGCPITVRPFLPAPSISYTHFLILFFLPFTNTFRSYLSFFCFLVYTVVSVSPSSSWCLLFSPSPLLFLTSSPSFAVPAFPVLHLTSLGAQFSHCYDTAILTFLSSLSISLLHLHSITPWYTVNLTSHIEALFPSKWIDNILFFLILKRWFLVMLCLFPLLA